MFHILQSCHRITKCSQLPQNTLQLVCHTLPRNSTRLAGVVKPLDEQDAVQQHDPENIEKTVHSHPQPTEPEWTQLNLDWRSLPDHYLKLSKSRLTSLVVLTSMAGYAMAPATFDLTTFTLCSVGTGLLSCAANSINQYHEVPFDAQMARTRNRILVKGLITPVHALAFASVCGVSGTVLLYGVNPLTAALGLTNLVLYTSIYTPLKRVSILNTWVGSVVGALPPLMGWSACSGQLEAGAWVMAGLLYAWQFPHFNALSWNLRPDYSRAGYRMMSVTNPGLCRRTALRYTALMVPLCASAPFLGVTNHWFACQTLPLNCYFLFLAWRFYQKSDSSSSRKLFHFSLIQLPVLMLLLLVNKKHWHKIEKEEEEGKMRTTVPSEASQLPIPLVVKTHAQLVK